MLVKSLISSIQRLPKTFSGSNRALPRRSQNWEIFCTHSPWKKNRWDIESTHPSKKSQRWASIEVWSHRITTKTWQRNWTASLSVRQQQVLIRANARRKLPICHSTKIHLSRLQFQKKERHFWDWTQHWASCNQGQSSTKCKTTRHIKELIARKTKLQELSEHEWHQEGPKCRCRWQD